MKHAVLLVAKGLCMGTADVIPGVSGGTMAFILGIYPRLLQAIRAFDLELARLLVGRHWRGAAAHVDSGFLLGLGLGIVAALMFFTRVVSLPTLLVTHPEPVYSLFFGLIAASIVVLLRALERLRAVDGGWLIIGAAAGLGVVNLVPVNTPDAAWFIFLSGAVAICAMILPGISGSFILLLLKKYAYVFDAIGRLDPTVLIPFALGAATGLLLFSRILTWYLRRFYRRTVLIITGVLAGSMWVIWPFQDRSYELVRDRPRLISSQPVWPEIVDGSVLSAALLIVLGAMVVLLIERLARSARDDAPPTSS